MWSVQTGHSVEIIIAFYTVLHSSPYWPDTLPSQTGSFNA